MDDFGGDVGLAYPIDQLHMTACVGGDNGGGVGLRHINHLGIQDLVGGVGLHDVIDAGAATAHIGLLEFDQFDTRDCLEQLAWLALSPFAHDADGRTRHK